MAAKKKTAVQQEALMKCLAEELGSKELNLVPGGLYAALKGTKIYAVVLRSKGTQNNGKSETKWFRFVEFADTPIWKLGKSIKVESQVCVCPPGAVYVYAGVDRAEVNVKDETHRPLVHTFVCANAGIVVAYPQVDLTKLLVQII
jgi:hypothetical protein